MSKYIDADRLYKDITRSIDYCEDILEIVERQPAADVAEVRHGRWIDYSDEYDGGYYECSVCGEPWVFIDGTPKDNNANYCPNCGAKMDEVEE